MKLRTWHYELGVVALSISATTYFMHNDLINWLTTAAVIFTFQHAQIGDRLQEKQAILDKPTVECYKKLSKMFIIKEILWISAFILMANYAALVGSILFMIYPYWRKYYRIKHPL